VRTDKAKEEGRREGHQRGQAVGRAWPHPDDVGERLEAVRRRQTWPDVLFCRVGLDSVRRWTGTGAGRASRQTHKEWRGGVQWDCREDSRFQSSSAGDPGKPFPSMGTSVGAMWKEEAV
jgi:hypothetical protein